MILGNLQANIQSITLFYLTDFSHFHQGIEFATLILGPYKPYITVLEPKPGSNPEDWNWRFEGWFAEVWFEIQVYVEL